MLRTIVVLSIALTLAVLVNRPWPDGGADRQTATTTPSPKLKINYVRLKDGEDVEIHIPTPDAVEKTAYKVEVKLLKP